MWFRLFALLLLVASVYSLSCPCWRNKSLCKPAPTDCKLGLTKDACGCCDVCFKTQGETCKGPWNTSGTCGKGLKCVIPDNLPEYVQRQAEGTCQPE
uniref:Ptuative venom gland protein n=1 Tax=Megacormus gertschi TaxID=1843536 RepID=A0A224X3N0_9SCOR